MAVVVKSDGSLRTLDVDVGKYESAISDFLHASEPRAHTFFILKRADLVQQDSVAPGIPPIAPESADVDADASDMLKEYVNLRALEEYDVGCGGVVRDNRHVRISSAPGSLAPLLAKRTLAW